MFDVQTRPQEWLTPRRFVITRLPIDHDTEPFLRHGLLWEELRYPGDRLDGVDGSGEAKVTSTTMTRNLGKHGFESWKCSH